MAVRISTAALVASGGKYLFVRRPAGGALSRCWELPGGKVDGSESPAEALQRELAEELAVAATVEREVGRSGFYHRGEEYCLIGFSVTGAFSAMELREHIDVGWLTVGEALALDDLAPSDRTLLESIFPSKP